MMPLAGREISGFLANSPCLLVNDTAAHAERRRSGSIAGLG
jgi:hypothetical protein